MTAKELIREKLEYKIDFIENDEESMSLLRAIESVVLEYAKDYHEADEEEIISNADSNDLIEELNKRYLTIEQQKELAKEFDSSLSNQMNAETLFDLMKIEAFVNGFRKKSLTEIQNFFKQ